MISHSACLPPNSGDIRPALRNGDHLPDLALPDSNGNIVPMSQVHDKIVLLDFWASWCKPCEQEAAELQQAWEIYGPTGEVVFVGADYVDTEPEARVYLKKFGISFPNGPDLATKISQYFRIKGVPETYFIDRDGVLQYVQVGPFTSLGQFQSIIDPMLNQ